MMRKLSILIISFIGLFCSFNAFGQHEDIKIDNVKVIKDFEARLKDFKKVQVNPVLPSFDLSSRIYDYKISSKVLKLDYEKPSIRPLALPDQKRNEAKKGHIKLGYGIPNAILGEAVYGKFAKNSTTAISFVHESASNKKINDQAFSNNKISFHQFNDFENDLSLDIIGQLNIDYINLYGIDANADSNIVLPSPKRRLMHWNTHWKVRKSEITESLQSWASLNYKYIHNNIEGSSAHVFRPEIVLAANLGSDFSLDFPVNASISISNPSNNKNVFGAQPHFRYSKPFFLFELGASVSYAESFKVWPKAYLGVNKLFRYFDLFAGVDEIFECSTMYEKGLQNPFYRFAGDQVEIFNRKSIFGGLRAHIEGAKFEFRTSYDQLENLAMFVPSQVDKRQFDVIYDDGWDLALTASLSYEISSNIMLSGKMAKHFYTMNNEEKAWHHPDLETDFTTRISLFDQKLKIDASLFFKSGLNYPDEQNNNVNLPVIFDISGAVEYELAKNFNLFAKWNNITATKYYRWYQYPSYRIHLLGGAKLLF